MRYKVLLLLVVPLQNNCDPQTMKYDFPDKGLYENLVVNSYDIVSIFCIIFLHADVRISSAERTLFQLFAHLKSSYLILSLIRFPDILMV